MMHPFYLYFNWMGPPSATSWVLEWKTLAISWKDYNKRKCIHGGHEVLYSLLGPPTYTVQTVFKKHILMMCLNHGPWTPEFPG